MLAWPRECRESGVDVRAFDRGLVTKRHRWRPGKGRAHQDQPLEDVGPHQSRVGRDRGAEIVADHGLGRAMAEREQHADGVAQQVHEPEACEVAVVVGVPADGPAVAALVGRDGVVARCRQRRQDLAPAISQFGKAVQQQDGGPIGCLVAGLQHMNVETVDAAQNERTHAGWEDGSGQGGPCPVHSIKKAGRARLPGRPSY